MGYWLLPKVATTSVVTWYMDAKHRSTQYDH
jgi:hypothetical protein